MAQPQTLEQKAAYAIGVNFVQSLKVQGITLDKDNMVQGVQDSLNGNLSLSQDEMKKAFTDFKAKLVKQQKQEQKAQLAKNKQLGNAFLAENKKKEGVITLASGLQYKVIKSGTGPSPKATDKVTTHYRGTLIDGTEFDSSYSRNKPSSFPVNGVIPGWVEALQLMHVGDKWQLFIPAALAYGKRAVGDKIKPNSTLIFDIELLKINGK
ncbi:MAG: FKBP-type peptidyl-prolyl cis-trans isomerase [gamma proteobacterium symbiont of Lucinoma myriamae]|nr:FKBP-type peptidyl-prolyl cis-trans isomerase [gamma proteobacterium symbiont of Lucinoma myriamae]MCU7817620.1 FKBP-type peptidyl-prolyl cis-trans isomerase [gamma proteobacterium symbiont of Lucinoma myriamae]MCU7833327.1 FKBP-type peptidyl-prolyl cis-trans isomerase [gamma proteobacterium symbiont of Lucinoma myriamae]